MMMARKNHPALDGSWGIRSCFSSLMAVFGAFVIVLVLVVSLSVDRAGRGDDLKNYMVLDLETCDPFVGQWVYDNSSHPLYSGLGCSFMSDEVACQKFGRNDTRYLGWRWQPRRCELPRFNSTQLLQRLKGKRLVYVGDSLNRNQWVSMVCILESSIPASHKSVVFNGSIWSFKAKEYNASIDFYWSPLLVESNCDDPVIHRQSDRIMRANSIEKHASNWLDADILIFNSYLWWMKPRMKMKVVYGSLDGGDTKYEEVEMIEGFEIALKSWATWLRMHADILKAQIFFTSLSPTHVRGEEWGMKSNQNCFNETNPITKDGYMSTGSDYRMMRIVEDTTKRLKDGGVNVQILNVTQLSEYRKDGHPSIYRKFWDTLSEDQLANPSSYADCTHWCLPGVPDTWNEILYAYIISK